MLKKRIRRYPRIWVAGALLFTVLLTIVALNITTSEKKIDQRIEPLYAVADSQFLRSMGSLLGPPLLRGNRVTPLYNGNEIFPAMLESIRSAQKTITFETFIYWSGEIGREFAEALAERAGAGVKVHVLLDWVGSTKMEPQLLELMERAGVEIERFHPLRWYTLTRMNNRTHRKLLIIDGRVGFTGGVGIADHWLGNAKDSTEWRDSHFRAEGPVVAELQSAFLDNWMQTTGVVLHGADYFPPLDSAGGYLAQVFRSDPDEGSESVRLMYLLSIASARKTIRIATPYFVPDDLSLQMLTEAARRGLAVEIIVPGRHLDTRVVGSASRARWGPLLRAGAAIYQYQATMYHCKVMIVDDIWTSVGSTNFDNRSFRLNDEANLNVYDSTFAAVEIAAFEQDKARSHRVTLEEWNERPMWEKFKERVASLLRSQL